MPEPFKVAGIAFRFAHVEEAIRAGMKEDSKVTLEPEPTNQHDPDAVKVLFKGLHIGYVPRGTGVSKRNGIITRLRHTKGVSIIMEVQECATRSR